MAALAEVVVIGAGVAGLTAAYRLRQHGHQVTVLEAKERAGGLSLTARRGSVVTETGPDGTLARQTCQIDPGLYLNLGPGRLPHHHRRIMGLCREIGVALEPYLMSTDANYWVESSTGQRFQRRRLEHDARGWIAEAAYHKILPRRQLALTRAFGDLTESGRYQGTPRAGQGEPVPLRVLERLRFWRGLFWQPQFYPWQATMFQPWGGMDQVWRALLPHVADAVVYNAAVEQVRTGRRHVRLTWRQSGDVRSGRWDWCLSSVPLPLLAADVGLQGFSGEFKQAAGVPDFAAACKVGWQANTRFWETEDIYGGISYTDHPIQQFWYPSNLEGEGAATLTGAYNSYEVAASFARLGVDERIQVAREGGALIHAEVADEGLVPANRAVTVAWHRVPFQAGGWCHWDPQDPRHADAFARLQSPDGRFQVIGDQVSQWPGWQEGCVATAQRAVDLVDGVAEKDPEGAEAAVEVPDSRWLTTGDHPAYRQTGGEDT